ncbi:probable extracytoplasmic function alternative sigma factor [Lentisphaera araneosa HTCC2155]|uniref:Probable extracytoplasmic function alternative sigma factor n=1 Tax=Lentisphaera araneosa HTCC2155 TaxID=313628 RepID=A6DKC0_9BACT|nr:sigma-70 family RNA polymerase sigma factor [Lentisphaera araneosa]EDM27818.1 probable extracytoplasmic function alternative sigma factor [Lentisphaera araneosa HTCC2155]
MKEDLTRITLIQKLQTDYNEDSWDEFINLYRGYVFVIIKRMNFSEEDCHDIMQTTFLKVWKNVEKFEHGGYNGQFRRWLATIARNTALRFIQKQKSESTKQNLFKITKQEVDLEAYTQPEIEALADKEWELYLSNTAWHNIKDDLNTNLQEVFNMSLEGLPLSQIAETLDLPKNTVSVYKRRVLNTLKKEIKRLEKKFS